MSRKMLNARARGFAVVFAALFVTLPAALSAQGEQLGPPDGWVVRTDRAGDEPEFVDMSPGWHITTGPAGIFYHPEKTASGSFRVESEVFLFDPHGRNEAFGLFIGGSDLDADGQAYTYFLIRQDGSVLIKRRDGGETATLHGWTPHDAVTTWSEREADSPNVKNVLAIEATGDALIFEVNGEEVYRADRDGQHVDGIVGLRVNHSLNLHFTSLDVTRG